MFSISQDMLVNERDTRKRYEDDVNVYLCNLFAACLHLKRIISDYKHNSL